MAKRRRRNAKVTRYRKPVNFNIGMLIFGIIFIYVVICVGTYVTKEHVVIYEVKSGSLAKNNSYTGFIVREETVVKAAKAGYVNYYAREGEKTGANNIVYTIDESGTLSDTLAESGVTDVTPSSEELQSLRNDIMNFSSGFEAKDFGEIYDFKYTFDSSVLKAVGLSMMNSIESLSGENGTAFERGNASASGIVEYYIDGYEGVKLAEVTSEMFDKAKYQKKILKNNELLSEGDAVYKMVTSEQWYIVIELSQESAEQLKEKKNINLIFKRDGIKAKAGVELVEKDGKTYAQLSLKSSMIR